MTKHRAPHGHRPDGTFGPHAFVDDIENPVLSPDDRHHLERVLRVRPGERCTVSDGLGRWRRCRLGDQLIPDANSPEVITTTPLTPRIVVGFTVVKGDRPERAVAALTEIGADVMVPLRSERSVVRWDQRKAERNRERLARIARESAMQSRRAWLPEVAPLTSFVDFVAAPWASIDINGVSSPAGGGVQPAVVDTSQDPITHDPVGTGARAAVIIAEPTAHPRTVGDALQTIGVASLREVTSVAVAIGPEGGWTDQELAMVPARLRLPGRILRAETAAVVSAAVLVEARDRATIGDV